MAEDRRTVSRQVNRSSPNTMASPSGLRWPAAAIISQTLRGRC